MLLVMMVIVVMVVGMMMVMGDVLDPDFRIEQDQHREQLQSTGQHVEYHYDFGKR